MSTTNYGLDTEAVTEKLVDFPASYTANMIKIDAQMKTNADAAAAEAERAKGVESTKQGTLTFDSSPTAGSTNPVTSGGIKTEIDKATSIKHAVTVPYASFALNSTSGYYEQTVTVDGITADSGLSGEELDASCVDTDAMITAYLLMIKYEPVAGGIKFCASAIPASDFIVDIWEVK